MKLAVWWQRVVSSEIIIDFLIVIAAFVVMPFLVCCYAMLMAATFPETVPSYAFFYGFVVSAGAPFIFLVTFICWLLDKAGLTHNETTLLTVFGDPLWLALVSGVPYLYLRRLIKRGQLEGIYCAKCGCDISKKPDQCPECGAILPKA